MSLAPQNHPAPEAPAGPVPSAGSACVGENLILLTHDESLIEALVNVLPQGSLIVVSDESALAHHLLSGHTGIVFIDAAAVSSRPGMAAQLAQRLRHQLPDVVLVAAGDGAAQGELATLVTDGTIYRFVHKPVSAQRVKLFVEAAWRKRDGSGSGVFEALTMPQLPALAPMTRAAPWPSIAAAMVVIGAAIAWYLLRAHTDSGAAPAQPADAPVAAHSAAPLTQLPASEALADQALPTPPQTVQVIASRPRPMADQALPTPRQTVQVVASRPRPMADQALPTPPQTVQVIASRPRPPTPVPTRAARPAAKPASAPKRLPVAAPLATTISSSPELIGPPSSTPPASEARDRNSVAAIILQRVYAPDPEFPEQARDHDLSGYVDLEFTVNPDGSVADVTVLKSQPVGVFDKSSVTAVSQWRYRPLARDGKPVSEHARLRLNFAYK